jgi:RNA polymerase sigma-70 factor (ECF subfamily)
LEFFLEQSTDDNLVTAAQAGDKAAFAVLLRKYYQQVFLTALSVLGSCHDAEDVAQDTFITGYAKIRQLREASQFGAWICRIARNRSLSLLSKRRVAEEYIDKWIEKASGHTATHTIDMQRAIGKLPPDLRDPIVMYYFDGQDVKKVARCLNISAPRVYQRLRAAYRQLRHLLAEQGDVS